MWEVPLEPSRLEKPSTSARSGRRIPRLGLERESRSRLQESSGQKILERLRGQLNRRGDQHTKRENIAPSTMVKRLEAVLAKGEVLVGHTDQRADLGDPIDLEEVRNRD